MPDKQQMQNIVDSLVRIMEQRVSEEKIRIAIALNEMSDKNTEMARPSGYADGYIDAIQEVKQKIGIDNTIYELYRDNN